MTATDVLYCIVTSLFAGLSILFWLVALFIGEGWEEVKLVQSCKHDDIMFFEDERVYWSCRCCGRMTNFFDDNNVEDCPGDVLGAYKED
jgi:hypothetical protein